MTGAPTGQRTGVKPGPAGTATRGKDGTKDNIGAGAGAPYGRSLEHITAVAADS